jgi:hypothetical protein
MSYIPGAAKSNPALSKTERHVFGADATLHPITGMVLEQGSGALSPDEQARRVHVPQIASTDGIDAARAILLKLDAATRRDFIVKG